LNRYIAGPEMGFDIRLELKDGETLNLFISRKTFVGEVMHPVEMREFGFTNYTTVYKGGQLRFLVRRLLWSGLLRREELTSEPLKAEFI